MKRIVSSVGVTLAGCLLASSAQAAIYATEVDWVNNGSVTVAARAVPSNALGAPQGTEAVGTFLSLGKGGAAVFGFGGLIGGPGFLVEVTNVCAQQATTCASFPESASVYGLTAAQYNPNTQNPSDVNLGALTPIATLLDGPFQTPGATFNIPSPPPFLRWLLIKDTTTNTASNVDGYDIDAIGITSILPVPVPAGLPLLAFGIAALGFLGGRSRRSV